MRVAIMAAAGLAAALSLTTTAEAAKGGSDPFTICGPFSQTYLQRSAPDKPPVPGFKESYALSGEDFLKLLRKHWPALDGTADAKTVFGDAKNYGEAKPPQDGLDEEALGFVSELFSKKASVGDGYIASVAGPNTFLSKDLLQTWSDDPASKAIICRWKDPHAKPDAKAESDPSDDVSAKAFPWLNNIHLRDSANDIAQAWSHSVDAGIPSPTGSSASIAFHHDQIDHSTNTFSMHAAAGVSCIFAACEAPAKPADDSEKPSVAAGLIYITADRINNASSPAKNLTDLAFGAGLVWFRAGDDWGWRMSLLEQADTDARFAASIAYFSGQMSIWPTRGTCVQKPWQLLRILQLKCDWNIDVGYAHVFSSGDFSNLNRNEYARIGGDVQGTLSVPELPQTYLANNGGDPAKLLYKLLSGLSLTVKYKSLASFTGSLGGLARFDASLDYKLSGTDDSSDSSTSISLTYTNGRAERTLERERYIELALKAAL